MHQYAAYGLTIRSEFELQEVPVVRGDPESVDVVFRRADLDPVPESVDGEGGRRVRAEPGVCRLSYETIGTFLVENGDRVRFDPVSTDVLEKRVVRRLFENEMMGVLLHQRGCLALHASAVVVDGRAGIFLGPRGAGKSTTAAAFHTEGYTLLEDDVVGIRFDDGTPTVVPGIPQIRLRPDAAAALDVDAPTRSTADGTEKYHRDLDERHDPAPLAGCYFLSEGESISIEDVSPGDGVVSLVARTYTRGMLEDTDATGDHFQLCSGVAETTPFRRLSRPDDHEQLPALVETVADDLRAKDPVEQ